MEIKFVTVVTSPRGSELSTCEKHALLDFVIGSMTSEEMVRWGMGSEYVGAMRALFEDDDAGCARRAAS